MQVLFLIFFGLLATTLTFKINSITKDGLAKDSSIDTKPFIQIDNGLYYIETKLTANWFEANERCHHHDAELVTFETQDEWATINKYLFDNDIEDLYWTSGNDLAKGDKTHVWLSNGENVGSWVWGRTEPDNYRGNQHCGQLGYRKTVNDLRGLDDTECSSILRYICEKRQPKTVSIIVW